MTKQEALKKLKEAAKYLEAAKGAFESIRNSASRENGYYLQGDAGHYVHELSEILSADDGEAGLVQLISLVQDEIGMTAHKKSAMTKEDSGDFWKAVNWLDRDVKVSLLEAAGFAVLDSEEERNINEALFEAVESGDIFIDDILNA